MTKPKEDISRRKFLKYGAGGLVAAAVAIGGGYWLYRSQVPGAPTGNPLKIAVPLPMTGTYAYYGVEMGQGIEIAVDELNATGGVLGRPVEVIIRDTEMVPAVATRRTMELIERENVEFICGVLSSAVNFAINEVSKREKVPFMVGNQTETSMHTKEVLSPYAAFPMTVNQVAAYANVSASVKNLGPKHYALTVDYVWGHEQEEMTKKALEIFGGEFIGGDRFPLGTTDYSGLLTAAREAKPDVLVFFGSGSDQINALKQVVEFGINKEMGVMVPLTTTSQAYAAGGAETYQGMYVGIDWYYKIADMDVPYASKARDINERFMNRFGRPGDSYSIGNYVGVMEICKAAERVGTTDADKVMEEIEGHTFEYHKGPETWRPCDRQAIQDWFVVRGLPPEETTSDFDFFEIIDVRGKENPDEYLATCDELGY